MSLRTLLVIVTLLMLSGCGSNTDSFTATTNPNSSGATSNPALETETVSAKVILPSGSPLNLQSLSVLNPLGSATLNDQGDFQTQKFTGGSQLLLVLDADGDPVLMGWLHEGAVIDINSTASVLLFFSLGGTNLPPELRVQVETLIDELPAAGQLAQQLANIHISNPKALNVENSEIQLALSNAVQSVLADQQLGRILSTPNPSTVQSGVRLNVTESANQISLTNTFRRRAHAFIKRVSFTVGSGGEEQTVESPLLVTDFGIAPIKGLTDLVGGLSDAGIVIFGFQDGNQVAYTEQTGDPLTLRTVDGSTKTQFKVVVVGPGGGVGELNQLTASELAVQQQVTLKFVVGDLALQMFFNIMLPNSESYAGKLEQLLGPGGDTVVGDLINTAKTLNPGIADKALSGDMVGALTGAYDLIITSGTFRAALLTFFGEFFFNADETEAFFEKARGVLKVTGAVDLALSTFDTGAIGKAILDSNMADVWDLEVSPPQIILRPENPVIVQGSEQTFNVSVPEVDSGVPLVYKWSTVGNFGQLTDGQAQHQNNFDSTSSSTTYTAGETSGVETITVEVFEVVEPGVGGTRRSLGTASTTVAVEAIVIEPMSVILSPDDDQEFSVRIPESVRTGATYQWDLASDTGSLSSQTDPMITYTVRDTIQAPATDTLTVEVMIQDGQGNLQPFGSASATITISDVDIVVTPTSATLAPSETQDFSVLVLGIPVGETVAYEWTSVNGLGTLSSTQENSTSYTVLDTVTPPEDDILRLRVFSEDSQGNRTLQGIEDIPISIDSSNWIITRTGVGADQLPRGESATSLSFANGVFMATGLGRVDPVGTFYLRSTDGEEWVRTIVSPGFGSGVASFSANSEHIFVDGLYNTGQSPPDQTLFRRKSSDGLTFEDLAGTLPFFMNDIAYGNGTYVAVGIQSSDFGGRVATATTLNSWADQTSPPDTARFVEYVNGRFYVGGAVIATSTDGTNWVTRHTLSGNDEFASMAFGNGIYVATVRVPSQPDEIFYSTNGDTWVSAGAQTLNSSGVSLGDVVFLNGAFYAGGEIPGQHSLVLTSDDGMNWTLDQDSDKLFSYSALVTGLSKLVLISEGSSIITSER